MVIKYLPSALWGITLITHPWRSCSLHRVWSEEDIAALVAEYDQIYDVAPNAVEGGK